MSKIRLDDMTIEEVEKLYNPMFKELLDEKTLKEIYEKYLYKYNEMKTAEQKGYDAPSGMGRRFNYLKNMLYGWYIEDLFFLLIKQNSNVKNIEFTGNDAEHNLKYDNDNKKVTICGTKTTNPDFLITLNNGNKIYLELKTAAAEVYSIKVGNVKQLHKTMGYTNIYSMIIMVDLVNEKYEIKDLAFFMNAFPFVNQRMEGQLCYDFPIPSKSFSLLKDENFESYINYDMFDTDEVKKYRALKLAEENNNKSIIKAVKNKISLDELCNEFKYQKDEFDKKMDKLISGTPNIEFKTWDDILTELNSN